eukprot:scaffold648029_cov43-Prasinocladus_malaysianus.AAC.1
MLHRSNLIAVFDEHLHHDYLHEEFPPFAIATAACMMANAWLNSLELVLSQPILNVGDLSVRVLIL